MVGWSAIWDTREYYETQYRIIQSDRVLSAVVRDLGLQNDPDFLGYKPTAPAPMESDDRATFAAGSPSSPSRAAASSTSRSRTRSPRRRAASPRPSPRRTSQQNLEKMVSATGDTVVWLSGQLDHFKHELEQTENSLHEFKKQNDLPSSTLEDLSKMIRLEMQEYDGALTRTRLRRQELAARHAELSKITDREPGPDPRLRAALERVPRRAPHAVPGRRRASAPSSSPKAKARTTRR